MIATRDEQEQMLMACHKESGISKTLQKIRERFYWKGMISDVKELINYINYNNYNNLEQNSSDQINYFNYLAGQRL